MRNIPNNNIDVLRNSDCYCHLQDSECAAVL